MALTVVVGVSGGIAAYKTAYLVSLLHRQGCDVHVLMTKNAHHFVGPITFETLTGNAVLTDAFDRTEEYNVNHVALAKKADVMIVAPATADIIAKAAHGLADDMLTTTLLAATCPVIFSSAMNHEMYRDPATQHNLLLLKKRNYHVMDTGEGMLACGDTGAGRMKEPEEILGFMHSVLAAQRDMHGIRMLVSAGPTREMIDPVRYLSNCSSGKMGYAIAQAAQKRGADVTLVSGPVSISPPPKTRTVFADSAAEMADQMQTLLPSADIIVMAAAVADFAPKEYQPQKIKKSDEMTVELIRTQDILVALGRQKGPKQIIMGFAAETENLEVNAKAKLVSKNLDVIALNDVSIPGEGFGSDKNNIILFFSDGKKADLGSEEKTVLASQIVDILFELYRSNHAK